MSGRPEITGQLKRSSQIVLDATGHGTIWFTPYHSNQRWEVTTIQVSTNQPGNAMNVPVATVALNSNDLSTMSDGNNRGASWSGNQDMFQGRIDVGGCDNLSVIFSPAPNGPITGLPGVIAKAVVIGSVFTRR